MAILFYSIRFSLIIRRRGDASTSEYFIQILETRTRLEWQVHTHSCYLFLLCISPDTNRRYVCVGETNKIYITAWNTPAQAWMGTLDAALIEFWSLAFVSIMATELFVVVDLNFTLQLAGFKSYLSTYLYFERNLFSFYRLRQCVRFTFVISWFRVYYIRSHIILRYKRNPQNKSYLNVSGVA